MPTSNNFYYLVLMYYSCSAVFLSLTDYLDQALTHAFYTVSSALYTSITQVVIAGMIIIANALVYAIRHVLKSLEQIPRVII